MNKITDFGAVDKSHTTRQGESDDRQTENNFFKRLKTAWKLILKPENNKIFMKKSVWPLIKHEKH